MSLKNRILYGFFGGIIALGAVALSLVYFVNSHETLPGPIAILLERKTEVGAPLTFAVVDMAKVRAKSNAYNNLEKELEEYHKKFHKEVLSQEAELRKQSEALRAASVSDHDEVSPEFLKAKEDFDKRLAKVEREVQSNKELLNQKFARAYEIVDTKLNDIIEKMSKDDNIGLLINTGSSVKSRTIDDMVVLHSHQSFDLTEKIAKALNDEIDSIDIETLEKKKAEKK